MKNTSLIILGLLFAVFGISLFMPWILLPNYETLALDPTSGYRFYSQNYFMLLLCVLILLTYFLLFRFRKSKLLLLLAAELIFLAGTILSPLIANGMIFFDVVLYGYYVAVATLLTLILYLMVLYFGWSEQLSQQFTKPYGTTLDVHPCGFLFWSDCYYSHHASVCIF